MKYILKNKLIFIILAGCLILAFELMVLLSAKVERKPVIEKAKPELKVVKTVYGPDWEDLEYAGGGHKAIYYSGRRNYQTADNTYEPIDTTITAEADKTVLDEGYIYSMTKNDFHVYFKKNAQDNDAIRFQVADAWVAYTFTEAQASEAIYTGNTLTYAGIYPGIDLRYTITNDQLLEELVVKDKESVKEVEQKLTLGGVTFKQTKEGTLDFTKTGEKTVLWNFPAPIMYEDKDNTKASNQLSYAVTRRAGEVFLTRKIESAGQDWLAKASFPVVLDATVSYTPESVNNLAYSFCGTQQSGSPPPPQDYTVATGPYLSGDYTNVQSDNSAFKTSTCSISIAGYYQLVQNNFRFKITQAVNSISQIKVTYGGYMGNTTYKVGKAQLKTDTGDFDIGSLTTTDATYTQTVTTDNNDGTANTSDDADYYLDASGYLYIRAYYQFGTSSGNYSLYTDYVQVEVTYMAPPSGAAYYSPNADYEIGMAWNDTSTDETGWLVQRSLTGAAGSWSDIGYALTGGSATANCSGGPLNSYSCGGGVCSFYNKCWNTSGQRLSANTRYYYRVRTVNTVPEPDHYSSWVYPTYSPTGKTYRYTNADATTTGPSVPPANELGNLLISNINAPASNPPADTTYGIRFDVWDGSSYPNPDPDPTVQNFIDYSCTANQYDYGILWKTMPATYQIIYKTATNWGSSSRVMREDGFVCVAGETLGANKKYRISVYARNGDGELNPRPATLAASTERYTLAATPTNLVIHSRSSGNSTIKGDASITIAWNANGNATGTKYRVEKMDPFAIPLTWNEIGTTTNTSYTSSGLWENMRYYYRVRAENGDGVKGSYSNEVDTYTYLDPPSDSDLTVTVPSNQSITSELNLSVTVPYPENDENAYTPSTGSEFFRYDANCTPGSGVSLGINPQVYTDTDTGLSPNTSYKYKVRYRNVTSDWTAENPSCKSKCTRPSPPTLNAHTGHSQSLGSIDWTWVAPSGSCTLTYNLYYQNCTGYSGASCSTWSSWSSITGISGASRTLTGLPNNTLYQVKVTAVNESGESVDSNLQQAYTPIETPTGLSFGTISSGSIAVTATGTFSNLTRGSSGIQFNKTGGSDTVADNGFPGAVQPWIQTTSANDTGLSPNVSYCYQAKAKNGDGDETGLAPASPGQCKYTYANPPSNLTHDQAFQTTTQMRWTWQANGNSAGTQYWAFDGTNNSGWTTNTYWTYSSYTENLPKNVTVKARNGNLIETSSAFLISGAPSYNQPDYTSLNNPTNLTVSIPINADDSHSLDLSVTPPPYSDRDKTGAKFYNKTISGHDYDLIQTYSKNDNNLDPNKQYCYQVSYKNGDGDETGLYPASPYACKYTRANVPSAPKLTAKPPGQINVKIKSDDGNPHGGAVPDTQYAMCAVYKRCSIGGSLCTKDTECTSPAVCNVEFAKYVKWNGSAWGIDEAGATCDETGITGDWHTYSGWGGANGVDVEAEPSKYTFKAIAKNEEGVPTKFGPVATLLLVKNNLVGWAWSSNVGWLSMNCLNFYANPQNYYSCGQADNWGVNTYFESGRDINPLDGYAWSGTGQSLGYKWQAPVNVSQTTRTNDAGADEQMNGPSIAIDSFGHPHIAWVNKKDDGDSDIYYIKWSGTKWVKADGADYIPTSPADGILNVSNTPGTSSLRPSLTLDSNNKAHIAWQELESIYFLEWNDVIGWMTASGIDRDVALDNTDVPDQCPSPSRCNLLVGDNTAAEGAPSLALESIGNQYPHIAFAHDMTGAYVDDIYYRRWDGSNWVSASGGSSDLNVSGTTAVSSGEPRLVLGSDQMAHIVWHEAGGGYGQIFYRWWNGTNWVTVSGDPLPSTNNLKVNVNMPGLRGQPATDFEAEYPSLALYADNAPGIVWRDPCTVVYRKWNGTNWVSVSGSTGINDLTINDEWYDCAEGRPEVKIFNEQPYVTFAHHGDLPPEVGDDPSEVYFRRWNGSAWVDMNGNTGDFTVGNISQSLGTVSSGPSMSVDTAGRVHAAWWERTFKEPKGTCSVAGGECILDTDCPLGNTCFHTFCNPINGDNDCNSNPNFSQCVYWGEYYGSKNKCAAYDVWYTGWLPSPQTSGLGWVSFNQNVCSNDSQKVCTNATDCGGAPNTCKESAGNPPGVCSNNITINCTADGECGSGNYCTKGYGYCYNGQATDEKYGECRPSAGTRCTKDSECLVQDDKCLYFTCSRGADCPDKYNLANPPDSTEHCKITSTANADGLTRQIEGYALVLSQKQAGEDKAAKGGTTCLANPNQPECDWGWIKLAGSYGGPGMNANTAGLWHFNEGGTSQSADDTSFNGNDGQLGSTAGVDVNDPTWVEGKIGRGLKFDGLDDFVRVSHSDSLTPMDEATVEAWIYPTALPSLIGQYRSVLSKGGSEKDFDLQIGDPDIGGDIKKMHWYIVTKDALNNVYHYKVLSTSDIPINTWTHVVATYKAGSPDGSPNGFIKIYINGEEKGSVNISYTRNASTEPLVIGQSYWTGRYFQGTIDEVRITNRALTAQEIDDEYQSGPYLLSLLEVNSQAFFADPDVNANEVKLYSAFGFSWSSRTSPGFGWIEFMPAGAIIGIPWLQTLYGDIFARQGIQLAPPPRGSGQYTSTYLIQSDGSIVGVPGYYMSTSTGPPTSQYYPISQEPSGIYQYQPIPGVTDVLSRVDVNGLKDIVSGTKNKYGYEVVTKPAGDISTAIGNSPILNQKVYYFSGDSTVNQAMTIKNGGANESGAGLIIVDGDLTINKDIHYEYGTCFNNPAIYCYEPNDPVCGGADCTKSDIGNTKQLASVAWFVKGNIYVNPIVRNLAGVFVAVGKDDATESNGIISTARVKKSYVIAGNTDDVYARSDGPVDSTILKFGSSTAGGLRSFLRWKIDVPKGSVIKKAFIKIKANAESAGGNFTAKQFLLDGYPTATDFNNPYNLATKSGAVNYSTDNWNSSWNELSDISTLVQKFIDRDDYAPNDNSKGYIGLSIQQGDTIGDNYKTAYAIEGGGIPELVIEYSPWVKQYQIANDANDDATAWSTGWDPSSSRVDFGWTQNRPERAFLRWSLDLPKDSEIKKAHVELKGDSSNLDANAFKARIGLLSDAETAFSSGNPYTRGINGSEVAHDIVAGAWVSTTWYPLEEITRLVQDRHDQADYSPGKYIGIMIRRDSNETVSGAGESRGFQSATTNGARLNVEYRSRLDVFGLMASRGYNFDREYVKGLEPAEKIIYDGRVMVNTPPGLGDFSKLLPVYQQVIP